MGQFDELINQYSQPQSTMSPWSDVGSVPRYDAKSEDPKAEDGLTWGDHGRSIMMGGASVAEGVGWLAKQAGFEDSGQFVQDLGRRAVEYWADGLSDYAKQEVAKQFIHEDESGSYSLGDASWDTVKLSLGQSALGTAAGMGLGGLFAKGFQLVPKLTPVVAGALGYGVGEATVAAGSSGANVESRVDALTHDQLMEQPEYNAAFQYFGDEDQARGLIKDAAGEKASALTFLSTLLLSAPFGAVTGKLTQGLPLSSTRLGSIGAGAAGEGGQEFLQSGAESLAQNYALLTHADPNQKLSEDVLNSAVGGMAAGGIMGGSLGTFSPLENIERAQSEARAQGGDALDQAEAGAGGLLQSSVEPITPAPPQDIRLPQPSEAQPNFDHGARGLNEILNPTRGPKQILEQAKRRADLLKQQAAMPTNETEQKGLLSDFRGPVIPNPFTDGMGLEPQPIQARVQNEQVRRQEQAEQIERSKHVVDFVKPDMPQRESKLALTDENNTIPFERTPVDRTDDLASRIELQIKAFNEKQRQEAPDSKPAEKLADVYPSKLAAMRANRKAGTEKELEPVKTGAKHWALQPKQAPEITSESPMFDASHDPEALKDDQSETDNLSQAEVIPEEGTDQVGRREVEALANEAATSPLNDLPEPTEAQKEAGNFKHGHVKVQGLDISVEQPKGSIRSGTSANGTKWERKLQSHYGYIKRTTGADNEHVDVFLGDDSDSSQVFVIDQVGKDGNFDEHKVMVGFPNQLAARRAYMRNYPKGWTGLGGITPLGVHTFKNWVKSGDLSKPLHDLPVKMHNEEVAATTNKEITGSHERETGKLPSKRSSSGNASSAAENLLPAAALPAKERKQSLKDTFATAARSTETQTINVGLVRANTPEDIAHIVAPYRKHGQETMIAVVTGIGGKILEVIRHTKGLRASADVDPGILAGSIVSVKGAKNFWFSHNHPSGKTIPSDSDYKITTVVSELLEGTGVNFRGHVVIGKGGKATFFKEGEYDRATIEATPAPRNFKQPVTERVLYSRESIGEPVTSPDVARKMVKGVSSEQAVILMNNDNAPTGILSIDSKGLVALKHTGESNRLLEAIHKSNAAAVILKDFNYSRVSQQSFQNIANFLRSANIKVLDYLYKEDGEIKSDAERGGRVSGTERAFFSLSSDIAGTTGIVGNSAVAKVDAEKAISRITRNWSGGSNIVKLVESFNDLPGVSG
ncbi:JAB domain-containing protein [Hahella ganghwensis]|uniref:JAB domain-containing protein n=1 Tax=Hahella ganghwensis TaxID=286420 RepID=UPI000360B89B|nr:JAB domain-containing protein [Hahella ganghwensis]